MYARMDGKPMILVANLVKFLSLTAAEDCGHRIHLCRSFEMREAYMPLLLEVDENILGQLYPYY